MEHGSIEREVHVRATPEIVFEVVTSPRYIREWWSADTSFAPHSGTTSTLVWTDSDTGGTQSAPFTIVEIDPPRHFSFRWTYDGDVGIAGSSLLVTFDLRPVADGTLIRFCETGFRERGWEAAVLEAYYDDHRQGWDLFLPRLATVADRLAIAP